MLFYWFIGYMDEFSWVGLKNCNVLKVIWVGLILFVFIVFLFDKFFCICCDI